MCTNVISFPFVTDGHFAEYLQESLLFYTHTKYVYKIKCTCDTPIVSPAHRYPKVLILLLVLKN